MNHVQTSLARQVYSLDDLGAYQAAALSVRDNLLVGVYHDDRPGFSNAIYSRSIGTTHKYI